MRDNPRNKLLFAGLLAAGTLCSGAALGQETPTSPLPPNSGPLVARLYGTAEIGGGDPDGVGAVALMPYPGPEQVCFVISVAGVDHPTAAHVHKGDAGRNGRVVVTLVAPSDGVSRGCVHADRDIANDMLASPQYYYVNVHNSEYPDGAIRGQLTK